MRIGVKTVYGRQHKRHRDATWPRRPPPPCPPSVPARLFSRLPAQPTASGNVYAAVAREARASSRGSGRQGGLAGRPALAKHAPPPATGGLRPIPVRNARNPALLSAPLPAAPPRENLETARPRHDHQHRGEGRREESNTRSQVLGPAAIRGQHPHGRPAHSKRSPAPFVHALSAAIRRERWFVAAFRDAAEKLRAGNHAAPFPSGSFRPRCPS